MTLLMKNLLLCFGFAAIEMQGFAADTALQAPAHLALKPNDIKWGEAPAFMPPGQKMSVLYGDPEKPGMFLLRAKLPANYTIPSHWHSTDEVVTVVYGTVMMGMGDKVDKKAATSLPAGSIMNVPAKTNHFLYSKGESIIQVAGIGPFDMTYVNPDDDPRNKTAKTPTPVN